VTPLTQHIASMQHLQAAIVVLAAHITPPSLDLDWWSVGNVRCRGGNEQAHLHQQLKLPLTTLPRCCHATTIDSARHITSHWPHKILRTSTTLHHSFAWPLSAVYTHRAISASHLNLADSLDVVSRVCRSSSRIEAPSLAAELRRDHRQRRAS